MRNAPQTPKSGETTLSRDPNRAMQDMMDTIDCLRVVYEQETDALLNADTKGFLAVQDEKFRRAKAYQMGVEELLSRKDEMKDVDIALKKKLEKMQKDFSELSHSNMIALERMQRTMDRLNGTIRSAVKDAVKRERGVSYNQIGHLEDGGNRKGISGSLSETA
jgi:stage III sporulation protein SpoIIIAA